MLGGGFRDPNIESKRTKYLKPIFMLVAFIFQLGPMLSDL
jgi:hypothetical protein